MLSVLTCRWWMTGAWCWPARTTASTSTDTSRSHPWGSRHCSQATPDTHQQFLSFNSRKKKSLSSSPETFVTFWEDHLRTFLQLVLARTYEMIYRVYQNFTHWSNANKNLQEVSDRWFSQQKQTAASSCNHKTTANFDPCLCNKCNYLLQNTTEHLKGISQVYQMFFWKKLDIILLDTWLVRPSNIY